MENKQFKQFNKVPESAPGSVQKSRGLAVFFGLIPGAGHMYLGKMHRGVTMMILFFAIFALGTMIPPILFLLPIIWFYAFFDCLNLSALSAAQREGKADEFAFGLLEDNGRAKKLFQRKNLLLGWGFVILGVYMIYETFGYQLVSFLQEILGERYRILLYTIYSDIPQFLLAVVIIFLGIRCMRGGKSEYDAEDIKPYVPLQTGQQEQGENPEDNQKD